MMERLAKRSWKTAAVAAALAGVLALLIVPAGLGQTVRNIIDEWAAVQAPPAPPIRPVTVDPRTTALLVLDIVPQICNRERRPRCLASLPRIQALLARAVAANVFVVYSLGGGAAASDILWQVRPLGSEPVVTSSADKFFRTDLERILTERGIRTVIVVGTAAHGAVLYTASGAAFRGLQVVVPVDAVSGDSLYIEQYTAWHLLNAPGVGARVTLTRTDLVNF